MAREGAQEEARRYLEQVLDLQRQMGYEPKVEEQSYKRAVKEAARASRRLASAADLAVVNRKANGGHWGPNA